MKFLLLRHFKIIAFIFLFLLIIGVISLLIQTGFWANIHTPGMIRLAKEYWNSEEYYSSIHWYYAAYSNALVGGLQWEIFRIHNYRTGKLLEQGKLSEALEVCKQAAKIWDQEGAASYECLLIEQELIKQK
jgi:hypothetical protein